MNQPTEQPINILSKVVPISIDIETTSTEKSAVILSIGAYNIRTGAKFYGIASKSCPLNTIRTADKATMWWWYNTASAVARQEAFSGTADLVQVLLDLKQWITEQGSYNDVHAFANPSDFDCVVIEDAVKQAKVLGHKNVKLGWRPTNVHSLKTITLEHLGCVKSAHVALHAEGFGITNQNAHTALADAIYQGQIIGTLIPTLTQTDSL